MIRYILITLLSLLPATGITAQQYELIPTEPAEQVRVFKEIAAKTSFACYATDDAGNIIFVGFCNRFGRNSANVPEDQVFEGDSDAPGVHDEDFRKILHFPELKAVATQSEPITNAGYAVLQAFTGLEAINLSNISSGFTEGTELQPPTDDVFLYLDNNLNLKVWDTTHSFGMGVEDDGNPLAQLQGYPELEVMILDSGHANDFEEVFPLIQKCPKIRWMKLKRSNFSEDQVKQIFDALPDLERILVATNHKSWDISSLRLVKDHPSLWGIRGIRGPLRWEDGLDHLVEAKNITHVTLPISKEDPSPEELALLKRLMEARPDLNILNLPQQLLPEGVESRKHHQRLKNEMELNPLPYEWNWAIGPR